MGERKELGRIQKATFGYGGYDDAQFGLSLTLGGEGWGVGDFRGTWATDIKVNERTQWTEQSRDQHFAETVRHLNDTLKAAKKRHVGELVGTPVEVTFDGNTLVSWRVLTEVL